MTDQLKPFLYSLLHMLVDYRMQPRDLRGQFHDWAKWGRISGRIDLAYEFGLITRDQCADLHRLLTSASDCLGNPFPHRANGGPVMPISVEFCRRRPVLKPQAQDSANEKPEPVPAPTSRRQLRLLCVLVKTKLGTAQAGCLPIHTLHRVPPRAMVRGQWSNPRYAGLYLRETHATEPTAEVLERCARHRQTYALRAPARTVRTGGVIA